MAVFKLCFQIPAISVGNWVGKGSAARMASTSSSSNSPCACLPKSRSGLSALMTSRNGPDEGAGTG